MQRLLHDFGSDHERKTRSQTLADSAFSFLVKRERYAGCIPRYRWGSSGGWLREAFGSAANHLRADPRDARPARGPDDLVQVAIRLRLLQA